MPTGSDHQADHQLVSACYEEQLGVLLRRVSRTLTRFDSGDLDAADADAEVFQYSRAAKRLWTFCNTGRSGEAARTIRDGAPIDWWESGAFRRR